WSYGDPLPATPETYIPKTLHEYVRHYVPLAEQGDERPLLAFAKLSYEAYPNSPFAMNDVAYFYGGRGEWGRSLELLRLAERADSTDALVLYNIAWAHDN